MKRCLKKNQENQNVSEQRQQERCPQGNRLVIKNIIVNLLVLVASPPLGESWVLSTLSMESNGRIL